MNRSFYITFILVAQALFAQGQDLPEKLRAQLEGYARNAYPQIHLSFHQPEYAAGDTAFFKGYLWKPGDVAPIKGKQVLNVALVNTDGKEIVFRRVLFTDGTGGGYLPLPADLTSDFYGVQAFTDEMRNDSAVPACWQSSLHVVSSKRVLLKAPELAVKAEGGALVAGVSNTIVVKSAVPFQGQVNDEMGNAVASGLASDASGWLKFTLKAETGRKYTLLIGSKKFPLPDVSGTGVALALTADSAAAQYNVKVMSPTAKSGYAVITANNRIVYSQSIDLSETSSLSVPFSRVVSGVNRLTIFDEGGVVLAERVFWKKTLPAAEVALTTKAAAATRENVQLNVKISDKTGAPVNGTFAVTVSKDDVFSPGMMSISPTLKNELGLTGFEPPVDKVHLDDYLVLYNKSASPWATIMKSAPPKPTRANPYYFRASVHMGSLDKPAPDSTFVTFYLNAYDVIFGVYVRNGKLEFPLYMNFQDDELYYRAQYRKKPLPGVVVDIEEHKTVPMPRFETTTLQELDPYEQFANMKSKVNSSFVFYSDSDKKSSADDGDDWNVDFSVNLERIHPFPNMIETLHNVVPAVKLRKSNDQNVIRIFTKETASYSQLDPVFIIDGVMTDSVDFFLSLDPKKLTRIGVIRSQQKMARYGSIGTGGIVLVDSKDKMYHDIVPRSSHLIKATGIQKAIPFPSPVYGSVKTNRIPDLRAVLYWSPSLPLKDGQAPVSFSTGDLSGKFKIHVEGMTDKGEFIQHEEYFDVAFVRP